LAGRYLTLDEFERLILEIIAPVLLRHEFVELPAYAIGANLAVCKPFRRHNDEMTASYEHVDSYSRLSVRPKHRGVPNIGVAALLRPQEPGRRLISASADKDPAVAFRRFRRVLLVFGRDYLAGNVVTEWHKIPHHWRINRPGS
jgi:hypothetical protein